MRIKLIHFYDVQPDDPDKGWVCYTSRVPGWEGIECRVADVVRDYRDLSAANMGFQKPPHRPNWMEKAMLGEEAVKVSRAAPVFLDRIMT